MTNSPRVLWTLPVCGKRCAFPTALGFALRIHSAHRSCCYPRFRHWMQSLVSTRQGEVHFAGFEQNEAVSLFNGNLNVVHPSSPSLPIDGGSIQLVRVCG